MENHEEPAILKMIGQYLELVLVFLRKLHPIGLTTDQISSLIKDKNHPFWLAFNEAIKLLAPQPIMATSLEIGADATYRQVDFWVSFYKQHFDIDLNPADIKIPERREGFNWLVIVAKGVTLNQVWTVCKKHFKCWNYQQTDDLESLMRKSERGEAKTTQAFWFRDRPEADEETKNLSANQQTEPSITLIARCLLELKYFTETNGKHLDIDNVTLCAGSRCADGGVPSALWYGDDSFDVDWFSVDYRFDELRSRVAVG